MNIKLFSFLIITVVVCSSYGGQPSAPWERESVSFPMLNSEIRNSLEENDRQNALREEQTQNLAIEKVNKGHWESYKKTVTKIQDRLRVVAFALQIIPTGYQVSLAAKKIKENQENLYKEVKDAPYALIVALPAEYKFIDDLQMTTRLLTGIVVSYGAINQMEKAERQKMLNYALDEVNLIEKQSFDILWTVRNVKEMLQRKKDLFNYYVNSDKQIVKDIIENVNSLKSL